jgi:hypothetical protein
MAGAEDSIEGYFHAMISIHPENLTELQYSWYVQGRAERSLLRRSSSSFVAELAETW